MMARTFSVTMRATSGSVGQTCAEYRLPAASWPAGEVDILFRKANFILLAGHAAARLEGDDGGRGVRRNGERRASNLLDPVLQVFRGLVFYRRGVGIEQDRVDGLAVLHERE